MSDKSNVRADHTEGQHQIEEQRKQLFASKGLRVKSRLKAGAGDDDDGYGDGYESDQHNQTVRGPRVR